jgi:ABC-2 type transport system ATP-binding protein
MDEDILEMNASDSDQLRSFLHQMEIETVVDKENNLICARFPKGQARPDELNRICMENGIRLSHLLLRKKKLETRFFELTND